MFSLALDAAYLKMGRGRTALVSCCLMGGVAQLSYHLSPIFPGALRSWLWCPDRGGCRVWSCLHANTPQLLWLSKEAAPGRTARLAAAVAPSNSGTLWAQGMCGHRMCAAGSRCGFPQLGHTKQLCSVPGQGSASGSAAQCWGKLSTGKWGSLACGARQPLGAGQPWPGNRWGSHSLRLMHVDLSWSGCYKDRQIPCTCS